LSIAGRIEIAQEGVEARQAQASLEPGQLPQLSGDQIRPFVIAQVAGQVTHQLGAGVGVAVTIAINDYHVKAILPN
jgi:hypothetical protein